MCCRILVNIGVIVQRDPSSWFISFPGVLQFMTVLSSGRDKVLTMVKRAKYSTVLESVSCAYEILGKNDMHSNFWVNQSINRCFVLLCFRVASVSNRPDLNLFAGIDPPGTPKALSGHALRNSWHYRQGSSRSVSNSESCQTVLL